MYSVHPGKLTAYPTEGKNFLHEQRIVQIQRPVRDRGPTEMVLDAAPPIAFELLAQGRIQRNRIDPLGQFTGELGRIHRVKGAGFQFQIHQQARFPGYNYFGDAADG